MEKGEVGERTQRRHLQSLESIRKSTGRRKRETSAPWIQTTTKSSSFLSFSPGTATHCALTPPPVTNLLLSHLSGLLGWKNHLDGLR